MSKDLLIIEQGPQAGREVPLTDQTLVFGRTDLSDIVIDHPGISRKHMRITRESGRYLVQDLGSTNGTWVNGERLQEPRALADGDEIRLGPDVVLRAAFAPEEPPAADIRAEPVHAEEPETTGAATIITEESPVVSRATEMEPASLRILLPDGQMIDRTFSETGLKVGRLEENDIVLPVPTVSREHFALHREGDTYLLIISPQASNPVYINNEPIRNQRTLADGDQISIGQPGQEQSIIMIYRAPAVTETAAAASEEALPPVPSPEIADQRTITADKPVAASDPHATQAPPSGAAFADKDRTLIGQAAASEPAAPPQLVVNSPGKDPEIHVLEKDRIRIGRNPENDIVIEDRFVSRFHTEIEKREDGFHIIPSPSVGNPLVLGGEPVMEPLLLQHGAKMRINGPNAGEMVSLVYLSPDEEAWRQRLRSVRFEESKALTIGRDPENDIVLDAPTISRLHAQVERIGQRYRVKDLNSSNGTYVNGQAIKEETWVKPGDSILVGPYRILVGEDDLSAQDESEGGLRIEAFNLNKWVRKDLNILQDISLAFQPREFIVIVGQSGGGKSTLVDAIAGYRPATHGRVVVNDTIDVYKDFDAIRNMIGFVPQKDIIHMELTVFQALDYAAQLRMPADTTEAERHQRIREVMEDLDLAHRADTEISRLSGGQQKRVSIGVELLTKPGLFFLDEPTSGLDPGMETELMQLMRRLADQGRTIVLITHATKNVMLADRVVFLARGGYLTWFGPPEDALKYFDQFRTERQKRTKPMEFDDIYNLLDTPQFGSGKDWDERFRKSDAYVKYISVPLGESTPAPLPTPAGTQEKEKKGGQKVSALRQFMILSARNLKILTRDRPTLGLMLLAAPLMASLDFVLAFGVGRNPFSFATGDFNDIIVTLILMVNTTIMVGGLTMARELIKEREIYKRERMVNLKLSSYIFSKLWFALVLAMFQAFWFILIRHVAFDMPHSAIDVVTFSVTVFLLVLAGMMMGLFTSAIAPNANAAPLILVLFLLPQMVLSGALVPLPDVASAPASSRWAFETIIGISGAGSDVAEDTCWIDLTQEERDDLTLEERNQQCNCMGVNALRADTCDFPGLGEFYTDAIDESEPAEPAEPGPEPTMPELPPEPEAPTNQNDPLAIQVYLSELEAYNNEVSEIQSDFEDDLNAYRDEQDVYRNEIENYMEEISTYETERAVAIGSAEATLKRFYEAYGWTFVDKDNPEAFNRMLMVTWGFQVLIISVLFFGTVYAQKSRDVA